MFLGEAAQLLDFGNRFASGLEQRISRHDRQAGMPLRTGMRLLVPRLGRR
jgi:hypothetical protein